MAEKYLRPSFFIIGERKCGTSSLYRYLLDHPQVLPCKIKEPQFFSRSLVHRLTKRRAYDALFPEIKGSGPVTLEWLQWLPDGALNKIELSYERPSAGAITGEASANTFAQVPPTRLYKAFPEAKLILLLRDPVSRAFSHYQMYKRFNQEGRKLPFDLTNFESDAHREIEEIANEGKSYFMRPGMYDVKLPAWMQCFGDQLKVIRSEDLSQPRTANDIMHELCSFLGIDDYSFLPILGQRFNTSPAESMSADARKLLSNFYKNHIRKVEDLLDRQMHWL